MVNHSDLLGEYLRTHATEPQELLQRLCRQPSVASQGLGVDAMADLVEQMLREAGFQTQRLLAPGAPPALYGELRGRSPFTLLLYNHYDVQPAEPLELWSSAPYDPTIRDGKLYARGSADNKGEIAARLAAVHALRSLSETFPITLRWIIEGEEEIGSPHFASIAETYAPLLQADGCLWEGAGFSDDGRPELNLGTKGLLYVQLEARGTGVDAHSGKAAILPSATWRLVQALATLRSPEGHVRIPGFYDQVRAPSEAEISALSNKTGSEAQQKEQYQIQHFIDDLSGLELRKRASFSPTCNISGLLSGYTGQGMKTVLPARAEAKIDFRLVPDQQPDKILTQLQRHLQDQGYGEIEISVLGQAEPVVTPIDHPFVQKMAAIAQSFANLPVSVTPIVGGTLPLLGALRKYVGVPGLSAPGNPSYWGSGPHAPDEHIQLTDLERAVAYNCYMFQALG